jgi:hypothetical protein
VGDWGIHFREGRCGVNAFAHHEVAIHANKCSFGGMVCNALAGILIVRVMGQQLAMFIEA